MDRYFTLSLNSIEDHRTAKICVRQFDKENKTRKYAMSMNAKYERGISNEKNKK